MNAPAVGIDVAVACRVLGVSRSGFYGWRGRSPSLRDEENALLLKQIREIHENSRETYGWPRVHAELVLGMGLDVNHKRVRRPRREAGSRAFTGIDAVAARLATPPTSRPWTW